MITYIGSETTVHMILLLKLCFSYFFAKEMEKFKVGYLSFIYRKVLCFDMTLRPICPLVRKRNISLEHKISKPIDYPDAMLELLWKLIFWHEHFSSIYLSLLNDYSPRCLRAMLKDFRSAKNISITFPNTGFLRAGRCKNVVGPLLRYTDLKKKNKNESKMCPWQNILHSGGKEENYHTEETIATEFWSGNFV